MTAMVLRPHFNDMEHKLRPGMITLTWTSMNIDTYKAQVGLGTPIIMIFLSGHPL